MSKVDGTIYKYSIIIFLLKNLKPILNKSNSI